MPKKAVLYSTIVTTMLLVPAMFGSVINASANNTNSVVKTEAITTSKVPVMYNTSASSHGLTESQISKIDPYVSVINDQYQLNKEATTTLSYTELQEAESSIASANTIVKQQHLKISQQTKTFQLAYQTKAAWNSHYTTSNFWWGTRYYFTSNVAVAQMQNELGNYVTALGITGSIGSAVTSGAATAVSGTVAIYLQKMSNDLGYYNATHLHNQIYMDVNRAGFYSMHVLA